MRMPESFNIATLLPDAAMRPNRPAEPFSCEDMEENVSDYRLKHLSVSVFLLASDRCARTFYGKPYRMIDYVLRSGVVVDIYCDAAQRRHLRGQLL